MKKNLSQKHSLLVISVWMAGCGGSSSESDLTVASADSSGSASIEATATLRVNDQAIADESVTSEWLAYGRTHSDEDVHRQGGDPCRQEQLLDNRDNNFGPPPRDRDIDRRSAKDSALA